MSDERQIDAAVRHVEARAVLPWSMAAPDEAMMAEEDRAELLARAEAEEAAEFAAVELRTVRAALWEQLLVFLFADGLPECWENVAMRGLSLMRHCVPSVLAGRDLSAVETIRRGARVQPSFRLTGFVEACESAAVRATLRGLLEYLFPGCPGPGWLAEGCRRTYLVARGYRPELVRITRTVSERVKVPDPAKPGRQRLEMRHFPKAVEMSYEDMARVFGEPVTSPIERRNARARWSAIAQRVIRKPIEANGGTVHLQFGKSASARATYAEKAKGNKNRKAKGAG